MRSEGEVDRCVYSAGKRTDNAPGDSAVITLTMAELKRAHTWEISDSEAEQEPGTAAEPDSAHSRTQSAQSRLEPPPAPAVRSPSPGARRRGNRGEDREERERQKEERERERERQKEERERQRERQKEERERRKEEKRQEQKRKKEAAERVKRLKPEEYLKTVTVNIHPALLQDSGCDVLLSTLAGLEWRSRIEEHDLTHTVSWSRTLPRTEDEDGSLVEEDQVLMVVTQMEFMDMIMSIKQALIGGCEEANSLFQPLGEYLNRNTGAVVSLLVTGGQYCQRGSYDDDDDEDELCPRSQLGFQNIDIEQVLVYLQLYKNVTVHFLFGWQEVTDHVCAVTKALSKRPFRTLQDVPDLGFCVDGLWAGGVRVDRSGRGLAQVWTRQIQQLNRVSVAMATAVTNAYPSPQLLLQAYEKAESEEEQRGLLADLTVRGGAKERRIGPELSNRVHRLMTSQNPELVLD
ncbi:probable crossover junction endonuclease EME2 isoform X2 [Pangasianodon hypophthalmus]|uniref:probable crossover junction endonuclease EME2 isoform X2 n=1 Tax=Pangasianodon hypophthalmus TaxID=310915 RepID=UPI000F00077B|nr:probable crossover junction endonuclease EME2 isoform X2 [Pangasianodon hypophthalmus]